MPFVQGKKTVETVQPIAKCGVAVDHDIHIERQIASYAATGADLTHMTLTIWLPFSNAGATKDQFLARLIELETVEDDTGKLLSTKDRLQSDRGLKGQVLLPHNMQDFRAGREGKAIFLRLDAPARRASIIKHLKGTVEVQRVKIKTITFENIHGLVGKPLEHPELKGVTIVPSIEGDETSTTFTMEVTKGRPWPVDWSISHVPARALVLSRVGKML